MLDLLVLVLVALAAVHGWRTGGSYLLLRLAGLVAGLFVGLRVASLLSQSLSPVVHVGLGVVCAFGGLLLGGALGRRLGTAVVRGLRRAHLGLLDRGVGALARAGLAALACWLIAALVLAFGPPAWADTVRASRLIRDPGSVPLVGGPVTELTGTLRAATPSDVAALVPSPATNEPAGSTVQAVDAAVAPSVLLVQTHRCSEWVVGTGFVAADHLVVTNAHVVRGASVRGTGSTTVRVGSSELAATVVVYDRRADLAVLRVDGLSAPPLPLATADAVNGTRAVVVGYPLGGPRTAVGAVVEQRTPVPDPGLSDGLALHEAYRLRAVIRPGNSGSPLLDTRGRVLGVVNASSGDTGTQGLAITGSELRPDLAAATARGAAAVSTGGCP